MTDNLWAIQRRRDGHIFEWTCSWWRSDAWDKFGAVWVKKPRRKLREEFKAVRTVLKVA